MQIYAGIIFYQEDLSMLKRVIDSCREVGIDKIISADGKFSEFMLGEQHYSDDEKVRYMNNNSDIFIPSPAGGWKTQMQKRQEILNEVPEGDYLLIIDADEKIFNGRIDKNILTEDMYAVKYYEPINHQGTFSTRLWKKYDDLIYYGRHKLLYRKDQMHRDINKSLKHCRECNEGLKNNIVFDCFGEGKECEHYKIVTQGLLTRKDYTCKNHLFSEEGNIIEIHNYKRHRPKIRQKAKQQYYHKRNEIRFNLKDYE